MDLKHRGIAIRYLAVLPFLLLPGCASGPAREGETAAPLAARFYLEELSESGGTTVMLPVSRTTLRVSPNPVFGEWDILRVDMVRVDLGLALVFEFEESAIRDLADLASWNPGRRLLLTFDGEPVGARPLTDATSGSGFLIFVELPDDALPGIVRRLNRTSRDIQRGIGGGGGMW